MAKRVEPVDKLVGKNIRIFGLAKGISQTEVGEAIGVTFQQVQKYENGTNRFGSSRLAKLSKVLGVPINRFFNTGTAGATNIYFSTLSSETCQTSGGTAGCAVQASQNAP